MQPEEINDILQAFSKLNPAKMDVQDQIIHMAATLQYAETIKPLVIKYANALPTECKFLMKL